MFLTRCPRGPTSLDRTDDTRGRGLTQRLTRQQPAVLPDHGAHGVPLAGVLDEGVALVHGASQDPAVLGEDALHVRLLHHRRVQVADEDPRVDGLRVRLVGHVAGVDLQRHAGRGRFTRSGDLKRRQGNRFLAEQQTLRRLRPVEDQKDEVGGFKVDDEDLGATA